MTVTDGDDLTIRLPSAAVIAERELSSFDEDGRESIVRVEIEAPRQAEPPDEVLWACRFRITTVEGSSWVTITGIDGFDAVAKAFNVIAIHLRAFADRSNRRLLWFGDADFGFPLNPRS